MIWDLLSDKQKEEVKEYIKSFGLEIAQIYVQVEENTKASAKVQEGASKKQSQIVTEAVNTIITLKEENKDLKTELNEVKVKLDSANADTIIPYVLLPIPRKKAI